MAVLCSRCDRRYGTYAAYNQHVRDSSRHHECPVCDFDGESWSELLEHCREDGCHIVCQGCNGGQGGYWDIDGEEYWEHVDDENVCTKCDRHFQSEQNLQQHRVTHRTSNIECLCCTQKFKTYGGMIIHIELGSCSNFDVTDLNEIAADCRKWRHFIDEDYHEDMVEGQDLNYAFNNPLPYNCPTCATRLPKLSSLFQHVESNACGQTLNDGAIGTLRRYLSKRLG